MKRKDRAVQIIAETERMNLALDRRERLKTREGIEAECEKWAEFFGLTFPGWTHDYSGIIGFTGHDPSGDYRIFYFAYVDVPKVGLRLLEITRWVTLEQRSSANEYVSPYLNISADAYNAIQESVRMAKLGVIHAAKA